MKKFIHSILLLTTGLATAAVHITTDDLMAELARLSNKQSQEQRREFIENLDKNAPSEQTPFKKALQLAVSKDYAGAATSFKKLSDAGDHDATYALATLHRLGLGVDQSPKAAQTLLEKAAASNHPTSLFELARLIEKEEPDKALALYRKAGNLGLPGANLKLAHCYETANLGVQKNAQLAFSFYEKSANAGSWFAKSELARCYDLGIGTSTDTSKGTKLYREAASNGLVSAQLTMAQRSFDGKGMAEDRPAAVGWLKIASQSGSTDAQVLLGDCFEKGDGVVQDYGKAGAYYSAAAKQGDPIGRQRLAGLYRDGKGTTKDPIRAYVLLSQVKGHPLVEKDLKELINSFTAEQLKNAQAKLAKVEAVEKTEEK